MSLSTGSQLLTKPASTPSSPNLIFLKNVRVCLIRQENIHPYFQNPNSIFFFLHSYLSFTHYHTKKFYLEKGEDYNQSKGRGFRRLSGCSPDPRGGAGCRSFFHRTLRRAVSLGPGGASGRGRARGWSGDRGCVKSWLLCSKWWGMGAVQNQDFQPIDFRFVEVISESGKNMD